MLENRQFVIDNMLNRTVPVQVYLAEVLSVEDKFCTVRLVHSDLEIDSVALVAEEDAATYLRLVPTVGSLVLVGCVENDVSRLYIAKFGEIDGGEIVCKDTEIKFGQSGVTLTNNQASVALDQNKAAIGLGGVKVELKGGKVSVTTGTVSLKALFDDLTTLLNSFVVLTAQGPSTGLGPNSITAVTNLKTKVAQLLQ